MRLSLFAFVGFLTLLVGCQQKNPQIPAKNVQQKDSAISTKDSVKIDDSINAVPNSHLWNNPIMLPNGSTLGNLLKAYYRTGQFEQIRKFVILKNGTMNDFNRRIKNTNWGYAIQMTNCQWQDDKKFTLTYQAMINNTAMIEQYQGEIVNDTAKIYFYCKNENPFFAR